MFSFNRAAKDRSCSTLPALSFVKRPDCSFHPVRIYLRPSYTRPPVPAFLVSPATIVKRATSREILSGLFTRIVINPSRGPGYRFSNEWPAVFHLVLDEIFIVYAGFIISTGNL